MEEALWRAVERLNSRVRNHLTPILVYSELLREGNPSEAERRKLAVISASAEQLLAALNEFVASTMELLHDTRQRR